MRKMCPTIKKGSWRSLYATRSAFQFIISKKKTTKHIRVSVCVGVGTHILRQTEANKTLSSTPTH